MRRVAIGIVLILFIAALWIPSGSQAAGSPPSPQGGFVDSIRFHEQSNPTQAINDLKAGIMDLYTYPLGSTADVEAAHTDPDLRRVDSAGIEYNLFVNPVPVDQAQAPGVFNPFAIREVREGLNYLVDRNYLNALLLGTSGTTHAALWSNASPEVARNPFFFADTNRDANYDFDRAKTTIFEALNASGATYDGNTWTWQGNQIFVQFVIRIEDLRLDLGNYVAHQVERLGLSVNRHYVLAAAASSIVYSSPPDTGAWMLYTEGWSITQLPQWPDSDLDYFHCGGEGSALWFFYSPPAALRDVCTNLLNGQYSNEAERQALVEAGVTLALNESVRVWLVTGRTQAYSARVAALAADPAAGLLGPFALRTARFASPGGMLSVGQPSHLNSPFQPWRGFTWIYDHAVGDTFMDPGLAIHPRTGRHIPVRADFTTTTAGPKGSLDVPADALTWDPITMGFKTVDPGTISKSVVRFHYTFGEWHHGTAISMDDVLYHIALLARRDRGDIATHDINASSPREHVFMLLFRGLKVIDETTLDVYVDHWNFDPSVIASTADVWPTTPWEVGELAMATTLHDHTRVAPSSAAWAGLAVVDLSRGTTIGFMDHEISDANITTSGASVTRPPGLASYIDQSEAEARWSAIQMWRTARGHYFASNGPYFLNSVDPALRQVTVTTFDAYPFPADRWDDLLSSPVPTIAIDPIQDVIPGEPGQVDLLTTVNGIPDSHVTVRFRIRPENTPATLLSGEPVLVSQGRWRVNLDPAFTASLTPGTYLFQAVVNGSHSSLIVTADRTLQVELGVDTVAPTIVAVVPADGSSSMSTGTVIRVRFSEGVDHVAAEAAFSISPAVAGTFSWDGTTLIFTPSENLAAGTTYHVTIGSTGVRDAAGNMLAGPYTFDFVTASETPFGTPSSPGISGWVLPIEIGGLIVIAAAVTLWAILRRRKP